MLIWERIFASEKVQKEIMPFLKAPVPVQVRLLKPFWNKLLNFLFPQLLDLDL